MPVSPRRISDFKPLLTNLAQTSHFQVIFGGIPSPVINYLLSRGIDFNFVNDVGLLCYSASLPGSSVATSEIIGNFTGVVEKMAHTRQFTEIDLQFYVDREYKTIKFLEHWIEFIGNGSLASKLNSGYFFRMQYPNSYKTNNTKIIKFERDYKTQIEYNFINLFPTAVNSIGVDYDSSNILKASATFSYERYVSGPALSFNQYIGNINNILPNQLPRSSSTSNRRLIPVRGTSGVVYYDSNQDTRTTAEVNRRFYDALGRPVIN